MDYNVLASGSAQVILAFVVVTLCGVVVYQNKKINSLYEEKDGLQERRLTEISNLTDKYNQAAGNFSTTIQLLTAKIEDNK